MSAFNGLRAFTDPETKGRVFLFPASLSQQRLWAFERKNPNQAAYNVPLAIRIKGTIETKVLENVFNEIVRRHESLRTYFTVIDDVPHQVIEEVGRTKLWVIDLSTMPGNEREAETWRQVNAEAQTPFDLSRGPLLRIILFYLNEQDYVLLLNMHHIICDGWSVTVLQQEVSLLYDAFQAGRLSPLPELPIQYADFTAWQHELLNGEVVKRQWAYWQRQLAGAKLFEFPSDMLRSPAIGSQAGYIRFSVPAEVSSQLEGLARQEGTTLYMVLLAAVFLLLYRCTGISDPVIGSPFAARLQSEMNNLIGLLTNRLLLRVDCSGGPTFLELLERTRRTTLEAYEHSQMPFEELASRMQPEWGISRPQVDFVFENSPAVELHLGSTKLQSFEVNLSTAKLDLTIFMGKVNDEIWSLAKYNAGRLKEAPITLMFQRFQTLLLTIATHFRDRITDVPISDVSTSEMTST